MKQYPVKRPWGAYAFLRKSPVFWVKKLYILKGERTSLQSHALRNEIWFVLKGNIIAQIGKNKHQAKPGEVFFIPKKSKHRLIGIENACVLEVAFGKVYERDTVRYEDDYGRVSPKKTPKIK